MVWRRAILWVIVGMALRTEEPLVHAQDIGIVSTATVPRPEIMQAPVTGDMAAPIPKPESFRPDKEVLVQSWFWRLLQGMVIGAATYNTEKQSDGRPQPRDNFR